MSEPYEPRETHESQPIIQPRRSCMSRLGNALVWLFSLILTVVLTLAATGAIAYYVLGYNLDTPAQLQRTQSEMEALREQNSILQTQIATIEQGYADSAVQIGGNRESLETLETEISGMNQQARELSTLAADLRENVAMAATIQAQTRDYQTYVEVFATVQMRQAEEIAAVERRTNRIVRFLARLGDIASDTAFDLEDTSGTPTPTPFQTVAPTALTVTPTTTPTATAIEEDAATATPEE